jgi:peroxiredoxin
MDGAPSLKLPLVRLRPREHRAAVLDRKALVLPGPLPKVGDFLPERWFEVPPARHANAPLTPPSLKVGLTLVSTLPNIGKHACAAQILELEEDALARLEDFRLVHVSADAPHFWHEVDHFHPVLRAEGFSLHGAADDSRQAFTAAFGVGVKGTRRIAHGLFALRDGMFVAAEIPFDQMAIPDVRGFLDRALRVLHLARPSGA